MNVTTLRIDFSSDFVIMRGKGFYGMAVDDAGSRTQHKANNHNEFIPH